MINKLAGQIQMVCDTCQNETPDFDEDEFDRMVAAAKADGWVITRPDGCWEHTCSDCVKDGSALEQAKRKFGIR